MFASRVALRLKIMSLKYSSNKLNPLLVLHFFSQEVHFKFAYNFVNFRIFIRINNFASHVSPNVCTPAMTYKISVKNNVFEEFIY